MRTHHAIGAVAAVILIGVGAKLFFFSAPAAIAAVHAVESYSMNILQMHIDHPNRNNLPAQKMHDMSVGVSDSD